MSTHEPGPTDADRVAAVRQTVAAALEIDVDEVESALAPYGLQVGPDTSAATLLSQLGRRTWSLDVWPP